MNKRLEDYISEAQHSGTLTGLPTQLYIDGQWRAASSGDLIEAFDPGTGKPFGSFSAGNAQDVDIAVASSVRAFRGVWRQTIPAKRAAILRKAAQLVRDNANRLAVVETLDSGKPISEAQGDIATAADFLDYYAGAADKLQGDTIPLGPDFYSFNMLEPVGVTAHILPWNFPLFAMMRGVAPALAAGCTAVVKPAETTSFTALMMAELFTQAGLPDGVCNVVTGTGRDVGEHLSTHKDIVHITFTGSVSTGSQVMRNAATHVASVTLELGGKSPAIVLADCDLDHAVTDMLESIYSNAGQVCSAGSRLVIERGVHDQFLEKFIARANALSIGHGLKNPFVGAINSAAQLDKIAKFVDDARDRGIKVAAGGKRTTDPDSGTGWFFQPTVLDNVSTDDIVIQEEIFGPVLSVQVVDDLEEALTVANGTDYGLIACVYTRDIQNALTLARDIDAGQVTVNQYYAGGIYTAFGGTKSSGFGREKGLDALKNYYRVKNITIRI